MRKQLFIYSNETCINEIKKRFSYVIGMRNDYVNSVPNLITNVLKPYEKVNISGFDVTPIPIFHGDIPIYGYRIFNVAYLTDTNNIPNESMKYLKDLDLLVLVCLQHRVHKTHFNKEQAVAMAKRIGAKRTLFTHIAHSIEHEKDNSDLPFSMELAYDTLELDFEE